MRAALYRRRLFARKRGRYCARVFINIATRERKLTMTSAVAMKALGEKRMKGFFCSIVFWC